MMLSRRVEQATRTAPPLNFSSEIEEAPVKSSERFCSMQIQTVEDVRASRIWENKREEGRKRERGERDIKKEKEISDVEQRAREKRNKSEYGGERRRGR